MNYLQRLVRRTLDGGERLPRTALADPFEERAPWQLDAPTTLAPEATVGPDSEPRVPKAMPPAASPPLAGLPVATVQGDDGEGAEPPPQLDPPRGSELSHVGDATLPSTPPAHVAPQLQPQLLPQAPLADYGANALLPQRPEVRSDVTSTWRDTTPIVTPAASPATAAAPAAAAAQALRATPPARLHPPSVAAQPAPPGEPPARPSVAIGRIEVEVREPRPRPAPEAPVVLQVAHGAAVPIERDALFVPASQRFGIGQT